MFRIFRLWRWLYQIGASCCHFNLTHLVVLCMEFLELYKIDKDHAASSLEKFLDLLEDKVLSEEGFLRGLFKRSFIGKLDDFGPDHGV